MPVSPDLTGALKKVVLTLEDDLRARVASQPEVDTAWRGLHAHAVDRERTAMSWQAWRDDRVTQAAVAWVLTSVFVRFCEDNRLLRPVWIAGPGERRQEALDAELQYFRHNPEHTDREWLLQSVEHLASLRATRDLVGSHSPLWTVSPSGQAVKSLLSFWRETRDDGSLVWDFTDADLSTRFLGDLYQDLSDYAKKTFALLQTPEFVEEFILEQTMEPALTERPLEGFRMIDPTCGSGHFLLGAFARLADRWATHAPALEPRARVQKALDAVHGVDLNPFAVAIARFRLMVAALQSCGEHSLEDAPGFTLHLAAGDSLLHGRHQLEMRFDGFDAASALSGFAYDTEDLAQLREILTPDRYDVVVGNPPYITVKDRRISAAYRDLYASCKGKYQLTVPFLERFFELARSAQPGSAGWVGQITSNAFTKREFGTKVIENFLPQKDLRLLIDSSGAYIPGHGTPTIILTAKNQLPTSGTVPAVIARKGESASELGVHGGPLWLSMAANHRAIGYSDEWIEVVEFSRQSLHKHPWSLGGGAEQKLKKSLTAEGAPKLKTFAHRIGFFGITGADEMFLLPPKALERLGVSPRAVRRHVAGEDVRDWAAITVDEVFFPYDDLGGILPPEEVGANRFLWPARTVLGARRTFSGETYNQAGRPWWGWHQLPTDADTHPLTLTYANVATHNHFALGDSEAAFNSKAVVIKFTAVSDPDINRILAVVNSSASLFWLRSVALPKPLVGEEWQRRYEFDATKVGSLPIIQIEGHAKRMAAKISTLAKEFFASLSPAQASDCVDLTSCAANEHRKSLFREMVMLQEELDWQVYRAHGLVDVGMLSDETLPAGVDLGERAFEIAMVRGISSSDENLAWFSRHNSQPITEIPADWPDEYKNLVQRRIDLIASDESIAILERPEHKRRWATQPWERQVERGLRVWLLDRLEDRRFWFDGSGRPRVRSVGQLADEVSRDADLTSVLELWSGRKDQSTTAVLNALLATESVPFLASYRYSDTGLRKREVWEQTWDLQRRQDAGFAAVDIPVPPKYASTDFRSTSTWQHRGRIDVPTERFILYPAAGRETDPTAVLGWAGWDHAQQALALASLIQERETEGWDDERLIPLIAGLAELQPWVRQWHDETDPTFGVNLADYLEEQLRSRASQVARTLDELHAWRPAPPTRGRKPRA